MLKFFPICILYMLFVFSICFPPLIFVVIPIYVAVYLHKRRRRVAQDAWESQMRDARHLEMIRKDWGA